MKDGDWFLDPRTGQPNFKPAAPDPPDNNLLVYRCGRPATAYHSIQIDPYDPNRAGPCSYDVAIGPTLLQYDWVNRPMVKDPMAGGYYPAIDPLRPPATKPVPLSGDSPFSDQFWLLVPGVGYLGSTVERFVVEGLIPDVSGRSSFGRVFLGIHQTAGWGDPGFCGHFTLEIAVVEPVILRPGDVIGQVRFSTTAGERQRYNGRYQNQGADPVPSRYGLGRV